MSHAVFDLERFVSAQNLVYERVLDELRAGEKQSHWMWFMFPQIAGLGWSAMAARYALSGLAEAQAFLAHPLLGARLRECVAIVNDIEGKTALDIFGTPDDLKFHSSMTLFHLAEPEIASFSAALSKYFGGKLDALTLGKLGRS